MTKTATQRDVTIIKNFALEILSERGTAGSMLTLLDRDRLKAIVEFAERIDARTGRRDPSVRKKGKSAGAGRKRVTR